MQPAPEGMRRFVVKSKFGMGRDFRVLDENEQQVYFVDGKFGYTPQAEVRDASDTVVYKAHGKFLGIPKTMTISDAEGAEIGSLKAKAFSPIKSQIDLVTTDGRVMHLEGNLLEKDYAVSVDGRVVMTISQQLLKIKDTFVMDVADDVDPALAAIVLWAVDAFVEQR